MVLKEYHSWNYPTQDPEESDLNWRLNHLAELERKLETVLGKNWQTDFYKDYEAAYCRSLCT